MIEFLYSQDPSFVGNVALQPKHLAHLLPDQYQQTTPCLQVVHPKHT